MFAGKEALEDGHVFGWKLGGSSVEALCFDIDGFIVRVPLESIGKRASTSFYKVRRRYNDKTFGLSFQERGGGSTFQKFL